MIKEGLFCQYNVRLILISIIFIFHTTCTFKSGNSSKVNYSQCSENKECKKLFKKISKEWRIHNKYFECYQFNEKLVSLIVEQKECFMDFNIEEILKILGKPTYDSKMEIIYDLYINWYSSKPAAKLYSLYFKFENQKIIDVYYKEEIRLF